MADREVRVKLVADTDEFVAAMGRAKDAADALKAALLDLHEPRYYVSQHSGGLHKIAEDGPEVYIPMRGA